MSRGRLLKRNFNNTGHGRKFKQMRLCDDSNARPSKEYIIFFLPYLVLSFFVLFCATQVKRQKIRFLFWNSLNHSVECFCCHNYLLSGCLEDQRLCRTDLFRSFDVPEEVILFSVIMREKILSSKTIASRVLLNELSRVKLRQLLPCLHETHLPEVN